MGPIVDRTKENLVSTDNGIIMARKVLKRAVVALRDKGQTPPGVQVEEQRVRSVSKLIPRVKTSWKRQKKTSRFVRVLSRPCMSNGASQAIVTGGFVQSATRRKPLSSGYKNPTARRDHLRSWCIPRPWVYSPTASDRLFRTTIPSCSVYIRCGLRRCRSVVHNNTARFSHIRLSGCGLRREALRLSIARIDRWMQHRFITTIMVDLDRGRTGSFTSDQLTGDLRRISSQLVG